MSILRSRDIRRAISDTESEIQSLESLVSEWKVRCNRAGGGYEEGSDRAMESGGTLIGER